MASTESTVEFSITSQKREYKIRVLKDTNYVSMYDLAKCCDFNPVEELGSKKIQELFEAFKHNAAYKNLDPLRYESDGESSNLIESAFIHSDIALHFVHQYRPTLALWIGQAIREANGTNSR